MTQDSIRHGNLLMMISQVDDPIYLEEPMIRSSTWRWNPGQREQAIGQVEIAEELPDIKLGDVPHYPLGDGGILNMRMPTGCHSRPRSAAKRRCIPRTSSG